MDKILSLKDEVKAYKVDNNVQELPTVKSEDFTLLRERLKCLEAGHKFLKDDINKKQKLIEKVLENNKKLIEHQPYVPVQCIHVSQKGPGNRSRSPTHRKCKSVTNSLLVKLKESKN